MKMGGLDMSSRAALLRGGALGPSIVPGKPEESLLVQAITHRHQRLKMPLEQQKLPDGQISDIAAWIRDGADWPECPVVRRFRRCFLAPQCRQRNQQEREGTLFVNWSKAF